MKIDLTQNGVAEALCCFNPFAYYPVHSGNRLSQYSEENKPKKEGIEMDIKTRRLLLDAWQYCDENDHVN